MSDDIASRLQKVRQMHGYSQRELAKRAGVTNSSVSMIEQGRVSPSISSLEKLLKSIPMTLKDFFSFDPYSDAQYFYTKDSLLKTEDNGVEQIDLSGIHCADKTLRYSTYQPNSISKGGEEGMLIADKPILGFVVQGELEITINNQIKNLQSSEGFCITILAPYRFRNITSEPAVIVTLH